MPGKNPFDLPKYQDTQTRVSSSISGGQHAQAAVQPRYPHDPIEKPTHNQPNLRVINGGKSSQSQGTNNPKSQAIPKSVLKRLPPPLLPHPFLWAVVLTVAAGSVLLKEDEIDLMTGEPFEETDPEESVNYLVKEIKNYDPDYTYTHDNDEADINFLANLLHYEKLEYYNKYRNACRQDFNPNLFAKTVRDLDAREDILNTLYEQTDTGNEADRLLKMDYENYKANGGTLAYDDWVISDRSNEASSGVNIANNVVLNSTPQFIYDAKAGRYRETSTGQFVAARNLPWPDNAGFSSSTKKTLQPGKILDRYGNTDGRFLGEPGTTISQKGMASGAEEMPYRQYQVLKPLEVRVGPAAPVPQFNATGGATQYLPGHTVDQLVKDGFIKEIK